MDEKRMRMAIRGHVQGVGYRWSMVQQARALGLRGWVRNRRDGSVEALVVGPAAAVERIVAWARRGPRGAAVSGVEVSDAASGAADSDSLGAGFDQRPTE